MTFYTNIDVTRPHQNVVEYTVRGDDMGEPIEFTMHANRAATFIGPHDGRYAHQVSGGARTVWHENDSDVIAALTRKYRTAYVRFIADAA